MVDFLNSNLCGASPEMNDVFAKLEAAADEVTSKLDFSASDAAAAFLEKQKELNTLTSKLQSIEIPELPQLNLPAEITNLASMVPGTSAYTSALTKITSEFGSAVSALGSVGSLDSLVSGALAGGDPCSLVPNLQKVAGSDTVTQKPAEVKQAAENAAGETASKTWQNPDLTTKKEEIKTNVETHAVTSTPPTEDTGAYKIVKKTQIKTVTTGGGVKTKVAVRQVAVAEERSNVVPKEAAGFQHKKSTITEKIRFEDIMDEGGGKIIIPTKYSPSEVLKIMMHPPTTYDNLTTSTAEEKAAVSPTASPGSVWRIGPHYKNSDGPHMVTISGGRGPSWASWEGANPVKVTIVPDVGISFTPPFKTVGDHPGDIVSVTSERWNGKTWVQRPGWFRGPHGMLRSDKARNKRYGGFAAVVRYAYLGNYDADWDATAE